MKTIFLLAALAAPTAQAEKIECAAMHNGARLIGAGMYEGKQKEFELMGGRKKVRGGWDVDFGFASGQVKWVACWYDPATALWHQVSSAAIRCDLKERGAAAGTTATVTCK